MAELKVVVWNVEWMNDLFGPNDEPAAFKADNHRPFHTPDSTVLQRRQDLSGVLTELTPDVVVLVEGPNRTEELQLFFTQDMPGDWKTAVQYTKRQSQNVGFAVRTDTGKFQNPAFDFFDTNNLNPFEQFSLDNDDDEIMEFYKFERRPLYVEIKPESGLSFRILGLHLKSKGVFGTYEWSKWWQVADANRRKILAQATQIRTEFLNAYLFDENTKDIPLLVCGDINDGPGLDASEKRLFGSAIERLMGTVWQPDLCLGNALFDALPKKEKNALDFSDIQTTSFKDPIFNNMWHRVWIDHVLYTRNRADEWVKDAQVHEMMAGDEPIWRKYKHASDHFPVSVMIDT